jgi:hypothetical protein
MFEGFLFRQQNDEKSPAQNKRVASCSTLDCGFLSLKKQQASRWREIKYQKHSKTLNRSGSI